MVFVQIFFLQPGGSLFITTPNRTLFSWLSVVIVGEKLNFIPKGTHEWEKFICPHELSSVLEMNCKYTMLYSKNFLVFKFVLNEKFKLSL